MLASEEELMGALKVQVSHMNLYEIFRLFFGNSSLAPSKRVFHNLSLQYFDDTPSDRKDTPGTLCISTASMTGGVSVRDVDVSASYHWHHPEN